MATRARIDLNLEAIADFGRRHPIRRLALFGSVLRDDFGTDSDVDVLVELEPGVPVGLIRLQRMLDELSVIVGRSVDLRTPGELSDYFRQRVLDEAEDIYVRR